MDVSPVISRKDERIREREFYERMSEDEKTRSVMLRNTGAVLSELRYIRWVLVVIALIAFYALCKVWPDWWHLWPPK